MQHYSISNDAVTLFVATALFVSFLTSALVIYARNQDTMFTAPKAVGWAMCARGLYWAAFWAALAIVVPMVAQIFAFAHAQTNSADSHFRDTAIFIGFMAMLAESTTLIVSIAVALYTVTKLLPYFTLGDALEADEASKSEQTPANS